MPVPHYLIIKPKPIPITKLRKETSRTQSVSGTILLISLDLEREPTSNAVDHPELTPLNATAPAVSPRPAANAVYVSSLELIRSFWMNYSDPIKTS